VQHKDIGVVVEAIANATNGAHNVFEPIEFRAQAPNVHVDGSVVGDVLFARHPKRRNEIVA
jgi:hypothetical protein